MVNISTNITELELEQVAADAAANEEFRRDRKAANARKYTIGAFLIVVWIGIWWALSVWLDSVVVPTPNEVWVRFIELNQTTTTESGNELRGYKDQYLWEHLLASLYRVIRGLFLGALVGVLLGLVSGYFSWTEKVTDPPINFIRQVPPLAYLPLMVGFFGLGDGAKVAILFLAAMPPIYIATVTGVRGVRKDAIDAARSMGASKIQLIRTCIVPAALPEIITGLRVAIGFAYTTVVAAELVNGVPGIGGMAFQARQQAQYDIVWVAIIVMGITGVLIDVGVQWSERKLVPWRTHV